MLFCIVTFNLWLHFNKLLTYLLTSCDRLRRVYDTEQRSLLMAGNNDEVYNKKPQRYAEDNVTQW